MGNFLSYWSISRLIGRGPAREGDRGAKYVGLELVWGPEIVVERLVITGELIFSCKHAVKINPNPKVTPCVRLKQANF